MIRLGYILIGCLVLFVLGGAAWALEFPPPEFETDYVRPTMETPNPQQGYWEYIDAGVLLATLSLATYIILRKRCRTGTFIVMIFTLLYFGFFRKGCVCSIGAIQNVALTAFDPTYAIPIAVLIFFGLPLIFTLFFGRVFCAAVCPLGAIQDAVLIHPVKVPRWLESGLRLLAYLYLGAAVLLAATGCLFLICRFDPFVGFFRLGADASLLVFGLSLLVIGLFVGRPYCRFLCPYGVILRQLSRVSKWRVKITPTDCIQCRLCEDACPFGAIQKPTQTWPAKEYQIAKLRLTLFLLLLPILIGAGAWGGYQLRDWLAQAHPQVRLAQRFALEEDGQVEGTTDASDAFRATGRPSAELYAEASQIRGQFAIGGGLLGAFMGFVVGGKLLLLSVKRRRTDYEADRADCLACGRCYSYCPKEHERLKQKKETVVARG